MLVASWAPRRTPLAILRSVHPWRPPVRPITLTLSRPSTAEFGDQQTTSFGSGTRSARDSIKGPNYRTFVSSAGERTVNLLKERKVQEAVSLLFKSGGEDQNLVMEVVEGVLVGSYNSGDIDALFEWLETLPDAANADSSVFHHILDSFLQHHSPENIEFIQRLGILCASKGYISFVASNIFPLVSENTTELDFKQWEGKVVRAAAMFTGASTYPINVFEEGGSDYASVNIDYPRPTPAGPSTLQMVEQNLPEMLPQCAENDELIFEDRSSEYVTDHEGPAYTVDRRSTDALEQLVLDRKYHDAYEVLQELDELSISIPPSMVYAAAAADALTSLYSTQAHSVQQVEREFLAWLALIPPLHSFKERVPTFQKIRNLLFQSPVTDLSLITQSALILAAKGFPDLMTNSAIRTVFFYASPEVSKQFLEDFEQAAESYWLTHQPWQAVYMTRKTKINGRGAAVRSLAFAGRFELAMELLPKPSTDNYHLTPYTYDVLLRQLQISDQPDSKKYVAEVLALRNAVVAQVSAVGEDATRRSTIVQDAALFSGLDSVPVRWLGDDLASSLRYLKGSIRRDSHPPHPLTILNFIESYLSAGRSRALTLLLNRAIRTSYAHTSAFLLAEMLYYYRLGHHSLVAETFVQHFYLSGIPRSDVLDIYRRQQESATVAHLPNDGRLQRPTLKRIHRRGAVGLDLSNQRTKLWPASIHCNLLWHSLANIAPSDAAVDHLYQKLLRIIREGKEGGEAGQLTDVAPLATPPASGRGPNASAFMPFMRRLMLAHGPTRGALAINDMLKLGLQPTIYHLTELAGQYARAGDEKNALMILTKLERNASRHEKGVEGSLDDDASQPAEGVEPSSAEAEGGHSIRAEQTLLSPDLVMYISLMRGFIISKNVHAVEEVDRRLRSRYDYKPGEDIYLDAVYEDLELLKQMSTSEAEQQPADMQEIDERAVS